MVVLGVWREAGLKHWELPWKGRRRWTVLRTRFTEPAAARRAGSTKGLPRPLAGDLASRPDSATACHVTSDKSQASLGLSFSLCEPSSTYTLGFLDMVVLVDWG